MRTAVVKMLLIWAAGMCFGITISNGFADQGMHTADIDDNKPVNEPTFETHRTAAVELCGGPVIKPGPETYATHVVVVKLDGSMVRMPIDEAWKRAKSKTRADDIWSIAVCRSDIVNPNVRKV